MKQIIIHGGVGHSMSATEILGEYASLALEKESPLEAALAAVVLMEDDPDFNAGTGSAMRSDGSIQMDASVMVNGNFGAVINIESVKNPVKVAKAVMERTNHCILCAGGATEFARQIGYPFYDPSTEKARKKMEVLKEGAAEDKLYHFSSGEAMDTVGAVANFDGTIASALSTGGNSGILMLKGRVGDTPIPGAGILVKNDFGIVATGSGEEIIKKMLAYHLFCNRENLKEEWKLITDNSKKSLGVIGFNRDEPFVFSNKPMPTWHLKK